MAMVSSSGSDSMRVNQPIERRSDARAVASSGCALRMMRSEKESCIDTVFAMRGLCGLLCRAANGAQSAYEDRWTITAHRILRSVPDSSDHTSIPISGRHGGDAEDRLDRAKEIIVVIDSRHFTW